jgi:uncharacterized protein GlcG (DUF336 family)
MKRIAILLSLAIAACGGRTDDSGCAGECQSEPLRLEVADVERIITQAVAEAQARDAPATIAVVDRVGNVLAVFQMNGAPTTLRTDGGRGVRSGLDDVSVIPSTLGAIAKAITAAYVSSEGNAFSTRTASQIVQEHFNPGEFGQPGGPLFGVQLSQLPCSDLNQRLAAARPSPGPHRSPLGLAADPGGLPLYKNGVPVGGVGVLSDGIYSLDIEVTDRDVDDDEVIALAATFGFEAPEGRLADRITVEGKTLRFADARIEDLRSTPAAAPSFAQVDGITGQRLAVTGYTESPAIVAGTVFGEPDSGVRPGTGVIAELDGFVIVDAANQNRFPPRDATDAAALGSDALRENEVQEILAAALETANRMRAQIRRPLGSTARVTISVVDTFGSVLGIVRSRDAPVFGIDVSLQKARTAAFFSNRVAAANLQATPRTRYLASGEDAEIADYVTDLRVFLGSPTVLADGAVAYSDRAIGNLSRPFFPDGIPGTVHGPLSKPLNEWSVFSTGLQTDLINTAVVRHVVFVLGGGSDIESGRCTELPATPTGFNRLANGIQIFPGSVPIYRGDRLVGAIGISGDGIDQDDMVAFFGLHEAGLRLGSFGNAPPEMRADQLQPQGVRLRYVQCPHAPFRDSQEQNVCDGK